MVTMLVLLACAAALALLALERIRLHHSRSVVSLVVAVTGTRGKSTVTRMLASVLRQGGTRVLAKTTGSEAVIIMPDGSERPVLRRGHPSIIEQKRLIHEGATSGVDAIVAEVMSIHAENHWVEGNQLLRPDLVVVTNFRVDHTGAMGSSPVEVESVIRHGIPPGARVVIPEKECTATFRSSIAAQRGEVISVPRGLGKCLEGERSSATDFGEHLDLVAAVARLLGVSDTDTRRGVRAARGDIGTFRAWRYRDECSRECIAVNAFAVNDPESTLLVHDKVMLALNACRESCIGIMNLREDRGDRTVHWAEVLERGALDRFESLWVHGLHAPALVRRLSGAQASTRVRVVRERDPAEVMRTVVATASGGDTVFGFGNIRGLGESLARYWNQTGEPLEL